MTTESGPRVVQDFLAAAATVVDLLDLPQVAARWAEPSTLTRMTVGDLAAHLARAVRIVPDVLAEPLTDRPPVDAGGYFAAFEDLDDLESQNNVGVRDRARSDAAPGAAAVVAAARAALVGLRAELPTRDPDGLVCARGVVLPLAEYLRTRLVELATHSDDLIVTLELDPADSLTPQLDPDAVWDAVEVLMSIARHRFGAAAVLVALARRERDTVHALRVL